MRDVHIRDLDSLIKELGELKELHGNTPVKLSVLYNNDGHEYLGRESIQFISYEYDGSVTLFGEDV